MYYMKDWQPSERTLVARTDFRKFNEFSLNFFYKTIVILQKVWLWSIENVSACDRRKPDGCKPDFDRDFFVGALCLTFILKLHPLFIYMYM